MGIYGVAEYGADAYGEAPKFAYSALPFTAQAIGDAESGAYNTVELRWTQPQGEYNQIRLLRSQDGFPETEEDGLVLWSWYEGSNAERITEFLDSPANSAVPLVEGRFAYYRIWVYQTIQTRWTIAGDAIVLVPKQHSSVASDGSTLVSSTDKIVDLLPRMYFSPNQSPHGAVDKGTTAYKFIQGFAFTLDEIMTYADNLLPEQSGISSNPALLLLKTRNYGLEFENYIGTKNQKKLLRNAPYFFQYRGTIKGLSAYCESLTGFAPNITVSPNLMLSTADSTFYKGLGNWVAVNDITLELENTVPTGQTPYSATAIDTSWSGKVTVGAGGGSLQLGVLSPRKHGIPVEAGVEYRVQGDIYAPGKNSALSGVTVHWYDRNGSLIYSDTWSSFATLPLDAWDTFSTSTANNQFTAPGASLPVISYDVVANALTLELVGAAPSNWTTGIDVILENIDGEINGTITTTGISYNTVTNVTTVTATLTGPSLTISGTAVDGTVRKDEGVAKYAALELSFAAGSAQTEYIDHISMHASSVGSFTEARAIDILFEPKKTNLLSNPSFEAAGSFYWTVTAAASNYVSTDLDIVSAGSDMLQVQATQGGTTSISSFTNTVDQGKFYTFSTYARMTGIDVTATVLTGNVATLTLAFAPPWSVGQDVNVSGLGDAYDGNYTLTGVVGNDITYDRIYPDQVADTPTGGTVCRPETMQLKLEAIDSSDGTTVVYSQTADPVAFDDIWVRYYVTTYVGEHTSPLLLRATIEGTTQGCVMAFDAAQLEASYLPTDYVDGDFPNFYGASWLGAPNQSISFSYPNKYAKLLRISETARDYLPFRRPYTVSSLTGQEFANME